MRRTSTTWRWSSQARSTSRSAITRGVRSASSTFMFSGKRDSSAVARNSVSISTSGSTLRVFGSSTRRTVVGAFVADVAEQRQLLLFQQLGDLLDQLRLLHLVGDFRDDDLPGAVLALFDRPPGAHAEAAAAGLIGVEDRRRRLPPARRRSGNPARACDAAGRRSLPADCGSVRARRRRARRHCAAGCRSPCRPRCRPRRWPAGSGRRRQDDRLALLAVIGRAEIDGVLVDAGQQRLRDLGQPRLGVAHGRGVIAVDVAEIALAFDQRVARGEILRRGAPAPRRPRRRRAGGTCRSRRRRRGRIS